MAFLAWKSQPDLPWGSSPPESSLKPWGLALCLFPSLGKRLALSGILHGGEGPIGAGTGALLVQGYHSKTQGPQARAEISPGPAAMGKVL
jgi:hypothetical protein